MKALGLVVSDKKIFENCILKTYFWPRDLHMQPIKTIWTTLVGDHPGAIPVKFGQNQMSGFRGEDVKVKKFTHDAWRTPHAARLTTDDDGQRPVTIAHHEHFVLGELTITCVSNNLTNSSHSVLVFILWIPLG